MEKEAIKHGVYDESSKLGWKCLSCSFLISAMYELIIIIKLVFKKNLHLIMGRYLCSAREIRGGFYIPNFVFFVHFYTSLRNFYLEIYSSDKKLRCFNFNVDDSMYLNKILLR